MPREKHKRQKSRGERTEAEHWDGPTRKSDEGRQCGRSKGVGSSSHIMGSTGDRRKPVTATKMKPFTIPKRLVYEAFKAVKANAGSAGVDKETIEDFEADLKGNLDRIWNRMSSGSYFPPPVRRSPFRRRMAGKAYLGVPTVADRVAAQMVVKTVLEPVLEPIFLPELPTVIGPASRRSMPWRRRASDAGSTIGF